MECNNRKELAHGSRPHDHPKEVFRGTRDDVVDKLTPTEELD